MPNLDAKNTVNWGKVKEQMVGTEFGGRGCEEAEISEEKRLFTESWQGIQ